MFVKITLMECIRGHGVRALSVGDTRVTSMKCCGSWRDVQTWDVDLAQIEKIAVDMEFDNVRERSRKNRSKL